MAWSMHDVWEGEVLPTLLEFTRIPNKSPAFERDWQAAGHMDRAAGLLEDWCRGRAVDGLVVERHQLVGRTPLLLIQIPAANGGPADETVLLYGHFDKQPEMEGWREGLGPWEPVREGERVYGRGIADDGYAVFAALTAIESVRAAGEPHARCVVVIEGSEESGSDDLPVYMQTLADRIGTPGLVIGLDSGCATYDRLWVTTSLRGLAAGRLRVDVLTEGAHSGGAGGIVPSSFRILRNLLDRVEDSTTGEILLPELHAEIPDDVVAAARDLVADVGEHAAGGGRLVEGMRKEHDDPVENVLANTWRPHMAVIGAGGLPRGANAGNVLRPYTALTLSFRLPPTVDHEQALKALETTLTVDPPYRAQVTWTSNEGAAGWAAPPTQPWLAEALDAASTAAFGKPTGFMGVGGTIPFMAMLGEQFPEAQFVITGVLGPGSNAHGPNEFLDLPTAERVTACVASILTAHATREATANA